MDIARPDIKRRKQRRRILFSALVVVMLAALTLGLSRLKPALPSVDKGGLVIDTVKRGELLREVRGNGTLIPEELLYVQAESEGRVARIDVLPGAAVHPDTVLLELSNPDLEQAVFDLKWQLNAANAKMRQLKVQLESDRLTQAAALEKVKTDLVQAKLDAEADNTLAKAGIVDEITRKKAAATAAQLAKQVEAQENILAISANSAAAQIAVQESEIERLGAEYDLKRKKLEALKVRAGEEGVLQQLGDTEMLQEGQRVAVGATLAKIVQPRKLKAEIKIAETQAKDIELGQQAEIDTRNGIVPGHVVRIDPAAVQGTVTVDVKLDGALPRGARPDLNVDGTIELERMTNVLYVARPVNAQPESAEGVFKLAVGGGDAVLTRVKFGRSSVNYIAVESGLSEGDRVITSDMTQWDAYNRVRLR